MIDKEVKKHGLQQSRKSDLYPENRKRNDPEGPGQCHEHQRQDYFQMGTRAGCPDVSLLRELSDILGVNIEKILLGDLEPNKKDGGNMKRIKFYVCPVCGNVISSTGMAEISCCGRKLNALKARPADLSHSVSAKAVEGDYYITLEHDMEKQHYITFMAYAVYDRVLLMKLYPEQAAQVRFPRSGHGVLYICCNSHGLFSVSL